MKRLFFSLSLPLLTVAFFAVSARAQSAAPAGATGLCKDGTYTTAATKSGACRGHQGVKQWLAASTAAPAASSKAASASAAQTTTSAPRSAAASAPATTSAPAGATGLCKDGSYTTAATKNGACRGHQGVKQWLAASTAAPAASAKTSSAQTMTPAASSAPAAAPAGAPAAPSAPAKAAPTHTNLASVAAAPGGAPGMVWLNTESKTYHCYGSQYYGKTKQGAYMSEADAKAKGGHADHNHPCSK
ncbi:MAG TPA: DUF3761 domain-containing protein [Edaphobacter sp.]|jgi:hypothetical protein